MNNDIQVQRDVLDELRFDPSLTVNDVGVTVHEGVVTLEGRIDSFTEKDAAERAAHRVAGVKAVANELQVVVPGMHRRDDTDIATAAVDALAWNLNVPPDRVTLTVRNGWITLEGEVSWQFQREAAFNTVAHLRGVHGVTNAISVRPTVTPQQVKQKIESALQRRASRDAAHVGVETVGGKVILRGTVRTWAEREDAEHAAWSAPGVSSVESYLEVEAQELALI
ncbi:MAG TPA: BON domain-containing protein [Longimicrobium sp.]|nr:BON domain-containing protein [Longimicrobium sp.]